MLLVLLCCGAGAQSLDPLDKAEELGASSVFLIECTCVERCARPLRGWTDLVIRSFSIAVDGRYAAELKHFHGRLEVFAVRPQLAREVDLLDFRHSAELIEAGYRQTRRFLEEWRACRKIASAHHKA
jgi:NTE family protein